MRINNNIMAMNANRQLGINDQGTGRSLEKLSSGFRINRAGDDAAGLAISEKMRGQIRGLQQGSRNAQDGVSLIQTAEGALNETHAILQRMRELSVQASNDTNVTKDRESIKSEIEQLSDEIDRIAEQTEFNTQTLLDGDLESGDGLEFQVGANSGQIISLNINDMQAEALGVNTVAASNITANQSVAIQLINDAIISVSEERSNLGAVQNRLEHTIRNADNSRENLQAAESRIRDVDMAAEMTEFSKNNILKQASQSMLAQANQAPQGVLQLLM
ncbi:flagellin [Chitinivibrio alkaliphilus]|uniref:Flagellin n=1 Tax=Chitinivibrio alkaliphilus ACht1 TaxID=1313304 RepID=U7D545_9BACT|nr:flagellin [Chitinivibrio alkaliphilus]ERP31063.1 flagellin [Chitinivibrio alkaliphilus ACht1]